MQFRGADEVIGSMSRSWERWRARGAPRLLCQWLRNGVRLRWRATAPPRVRPEDVRRPTREAREELEQMVRDGAFAPIDAQDAVVAPIFVVPKSDGGRRLIHDLRHVNRFLDAPHFTLHGARDAAQVVRNSSWLCALDLRRGYQQVLMEPEARRYLATRVGGRTYGATVLPFGLSLSPYVFTRLTNFLAKLIRRETGLMVSVYIDDFLVGGRTRQEVEQGLRRIRELFDELGVRLSAKRPLEPAQETEFIGLLWSAREKTIGVTQARRREYMRAIKNLLRTPQPVARWRTLIGRLLFLRDAVGLALRHARSLLRAVRGRRDAARLAAEGEAREDLLWWLQALREGRKASVVYSEAAASIATDASDSTLGYSIQAGAQTVRDTLPAADAQASINTKELEALLAAVRQNAALLRGKKVVWYTDNVTARAAIMREGTQRIGPETWGMAKRALDLLGALRISIVAKRVPGALNRTADALSRPEEGDAGWKAALRAVTDAWGPLEADLSGVTGGQEAPLDDLRWLGTRCLLKPRTAGIAECLELLARVREAPAPGSHPSLWASCVVLVTPLWRGALWWRRLEELRTDWRELGRLEDPQLQGWQRRNGHPASWTASLIPTRRRRGPRQRQGNTGGCFTLTSSGATTTGGTALTHQSSSARRATASDGPQQA